MPPEGYYFILTQEIIDRAINSLKNSIEETIDIEYEEVKPKQLEENNEKRSN